MVDQGLSSQTKQTPFSVLRAGSTPAGIPIPTWAILLNQAAKCVHIPGLCFLTPLKGGHKSEKIGIFPI